MGDHTAALTDHLQGDSDDDDDNGADEDVAQTTDQTPPQDAVVTSEPATKASDDCSEVSDKPQRSSYSFGPLWTSALLRVVRGDRCPACGQM